MRWVAGSARRPSRATSPSTVTRPAAMSSSQARREPIPARASSFWSRSGSPTSDAGPSRPGVVDGARRVAELEVDGVAERGRRVLDPQTALERLDDRGVRYEVAERGQVGERVEAEPLQERGSGAVEHRLTGAGVAPDLLDV